MQIRESSEMYLKTILLLSKKGTVRAIDIAREMGFSRASVSVTIHNLENEHFVKISDEGLITLEKKGLDIAERIYERNTIFTRILEELGVPSDIAEADACKIEHVVSVETFNCLKNYLNNHNRGDLLKNEQ